MPVKLTIPGDRPLAKNRLDNIGWKKMLKALSKEFGVACRALLKRPRYTALIVLTLSLGIGATSSVFSVVSSVLLTPLPYPDSDRLVFFRLFAGDLNGSHWASLGEFLTFGESENLETVAAVAGGPSSYVEVGDQTLSVSSGTASANLFPLLGVSPFMGRLFTDEDARTPFGQGTPQPPVVISYSAWQTTFGADPEIIGRRIVYEGGNPGPTIAGVLPESFNLELQNGMDGSKDIWRVLRTAGNPNYGFRFLRGVIGKIKPGVTLETAQAENDIIMRHLAEEHPEANSDGPNPRFKLVPLFSDLVGPVKPTILILFAAVSLVFLISCGNAASVLLARTAMRQKELAIRAALGASRAAVARIIIVESFVLAILAGALGTLIAYWGSSLLMLIEPGQLPRMDGVGVDSKVLAFTISLSLVATLLFGLLPALKASSPEIMNQSLRQGAKLATGLGAGARGALVSGQIAFSIILLVSTGLLVRSFLNLQNQELGYEPDNVLTFRARLDGRLHRGPQKRWEVYNRYVTAIKELPEVSNASLVTYVPLSSVAWSWDTTADGANGSVTAYVRHILPGYTETLRIPLINGRTLTEADLNNADTVAVVNQTLARFFWPDESPIGKWIQWSYGGPPIRLRVVGVVGDARLTSVGQPASPAFYLPFTLQPFGQRIVLRHNGQLGSLLPKLELLAEEVGTGRIIDQIQPLDELVAASNEGTEFAARIMTLLGAIALLLSAIGIYGTIAYLVTLKTKELGIRVALGAQRRDIISLNVKEGLKLTVIGIAVGAFGAFAVTRFLATLLYGISTTDPLTFISASTMFVVLGGIASLIPSLRAAGINPIISLREE